MSIDEFKQTILSKGFKSVDVELEETEFYVRVWFDFRWAHDQTKTTTGWQGFFGKCLEAIVSDIDEFVALHQTGQWIIHLTR